jgi:hypothetical protein
VIFTINIKGGAEVLKQMAAAEIDALAKKVADEAGDEAVVDKYTTDRAAAMVSVPAVQQARDGVLTRAVSAAGLEMRLK